MAIARTREHDRDEDGAPTQQRLSSVDNVLEVVDAIPKGRVLSYGDVAELAGVASARIVGRVLSHVGSGHCWHRVVMADGSMAPNLATEQIALLCAERVPFKPGQHRIDMVRARWHATSAH